MLNKIKTCVELVFKHNRFWIVDDKKATLPIGQVKKFDWTIAEGDDLSLIKRIWTKSIAWIRSKQNTTPNRVRFTFPYVIYTSLEIITIMQEVLNVNPEMYNLF